MDYTAEAEALNAEDLAALAALAEAEAADAALADLAAEADIPALMVGGAEGCADCAPYDCVCVDCACGRGVHTGHCA